MQRIISYKKKDIKKWLVAAGLLLALDLSCLESMSAAFEVPLFIQPAVAYNPRNFTPGTDTSGPSKEQIIEDLRLLRMVGFRSLVTYGSQGSLGSIPELARQQGFDGTVIMGIWDINSQRELKKALTNAPFVDGYCLGNEGLGIRYSPDELALKMTELRRLSGRPVTTSEPIARYLDGAYRDWLLNHSDWLFPTAHPYWAIGPNPKHALKWIIARYDYLAANTERQVVFKEMGYPTSGLRGSNEEFQIVLFQGLESVGLPFFYFEAFDQVWKRDSSGHDVEAHWGLYKADGKPKKIIRWLTNHRGKQ